MNKLLVIVIILFCSLSWGQYPSGTSAYYVSGVGSRVYEITTPTNYDYTKEYPIVFELHGMGFHRGRIHDFDNEAQRQTVVDELQYISVRPEGEIARTGVSSSFSTSLNMRMWNSWSVTNSFPMILPNDVSYIQQVYQVVSNVIGNAFNPNKVYIYGFSNGGAMVMKLIQETTLFKAAVIHSMSLMTNQSVNSGMEKIPLMFIHGTSDTYVPYNGGRPTNSSIPSVVRSLIRFRSVKQTVDMWADVYGLSYRFEAEYDNSGVFTRKFFYREYTHLQHPIYFYVSQDTPHVTNAGFEISNVRRAFIRFFNNPTYSGIYRNPL